MFNIQRLRVRIVHLLPYLVIGAAVALLAAAIAVNGSPFADVFNTLAVVAGVSSILLLMQRSMLRIMEANHNEIMQELRDNIVLIAAASANDTMLAHLGPDSQWRHNLIKELADLLNDDHEITVAAVEGSIHDIVKRLDALERNNRHQGK